MREDVKSFVDEMCRQDWESVSVEDHHCGLGVACMQAYINGIKPALKDLSEFLNVEESELEEPFQRLLQAGMFSKAFNARGDDALNLKLKNTRDVGQIRCAWGHVAAISAGIIFRNYNNMDM